MVSVWFVIVKSSRVREMPLDREGAGAGSTPVVNMVTNVAVGGPEIVVGCDGREVEVSVEEKLWVKC